MVITTSKNRFFSGLLAAIYVLAGLLIGGGEGGLVVLCLVIVPLAFIWFGDAIGGYTGLSVDIWVNAPTPGIIVCIFGWVILLLPIIIGVGYAVRALFKVAA